MSWKTKLLIAALTTSHLFVVQEVKASSRKQNSDRVDTIDFAFMKLSGYSTALASLYIEEARCRLGSKLGLRAEVQSTARKYIKPSMVESFLDRTFDDHIKRSFSEYDTDPCDRNEIDRTRALAASFLDQAVAAFREAQYP